MLGKRFVKNLYGKRESGISVWVTETRVWVHCHGLIDVIVVGNRGYTQISGEVPCTSQLEPAIQIICRITSVGVAERG